jgi:CrcB protein
VLAAVAAGGALGTAARYGFETAFPTDLARFPWITLWINLAGCLLLGVVLYIVFERRPPSPLLRPFLAIGVLGGFTTFSTFAVEVAQRAPDHARTAAIYLAASLVGGPLAVLAGSAAVRRIYAMPSGMARRRSSR